jgi:hypothetical protein
MYTLNVGDSMFILRVFRGDLPVLGECESIPHFKNSPNIKLKHVNNLPTNSMSWAASLLLTLTVKTH